MVLLPVVAGCCLFAFGSAKSTEDGGTFDSALFADDECASDDEACVLGMLQVRQQRADEGMSKELVTAALEKWASERPESLRRRTGVEFLQQASPYADCHLDKSPSSCSLEGMKAQPTLVYPGGRSRCFNGDPYAFAVVPGDKDKLMFYFEGGGACWKAKGNVVLQCTDSLSQAIADSGFGLGIQNRTDERNAFRTYTVVELLYCTGDAHMGNITQDWDEKTYHQRGYHNTMAAVKWAAQNFPGELKELTITGFSAGALGTYGWADKILEEFPHEKASVFGDSYAAVFPPGIEGPTLQEWGACDTDIWTDKLRDECGAGALTMQAAVMQAMEAHPGAGFGNIQSKADESQMWFYKGLAMSNFMMDEATLTGPAFYAKTLDKFKEYSNAFPNYAEIFIDGHTHCFTQSSYYFLTSTAGRDGKGDDALDGEEVMLYDWIGKLVEQGDVASACEGKIEKESEKDTHYCDAALYPKVMKLRKK